VYNSKNVLYITDFNLPERYPAKKNANVFFASNVILNDSDIVSSHKRISNQNYCKIISIGSLEQMYKGPDVLLKSIKLLTLAGINVKLTWIGEGKHKADMISLTEKLKLQN